MNTYFKTLLLGDLCEESSERGGEKLRTGEKFMGITFAGVRKIPYLCGVVLLVAIQHRFRPRRKARIFCFERFSFRRVYCYQTCEQKRRERKISRKLVVISVQHKVFCLLK